MQKMTCEQTRRELDELNLDDEIGGATGRHLRECVACHEFQTLQAKLRQLVGSLGTVQAPADFDFKLRARLASEPTARGFHFWPVAKWSLTAVTAVVLFVGGFSVLRQMTQTPAPPSQVLAERPASIPNVGQAPQTSVTPVPNNGAAGSQTEKDFVASSGAGTSPRKVVKSSEPRRARQFQVLDSASTRAPVVSAASREDVVFAVDASGKPLTVSVDDGRGNAKTISLPTVTFGSQRVIGNNHFAAKGVW